MWTASSPTPGRRSGAMPVCHCDQCRNLPPSGTPRLLGQVQRAHRLPLEALRFHRQGEEAVEFLFRQPRRRHPLHRRPRATRRALRVVPVRQPGPRRRRYAHLGMRPAGPRLQRRAEGQDGHQRHRRLVHRHAPLAQRLQVAAGRADVVRRDPRLAAWCPTTTSSAAKTAWARTAAGWSRRTSISTGWPSTTPTSSTSAPSPISGVVMGQRTHLFYKPPRGVADARSTWTACTTPCSKAASSSISCTKTSSRPSDLRKYSALLLPNTALLSDEQCRQLARLCRMPADRCWPPSRPACTTSATSAAPISAWPDVFGIRKAGEIVGTSGNAYLARIEKPHAILDGFANTHWIPGAENRVPLAPVDAPVLTVVPGFVAYPPELSYPLEPHTDRARRRRARKRQEPPGLFPRRHRAHHVALRPYRSRPAAAERHPLGGRRQSTRHRGRRRRHRNLRLGDRGRLRRPHPELHQPRHAPRLDPRISTPSAPKKSACRSPPEPASRASFSCAPKPPSPSAGSPAPSNSPSPASSTTRSPQSQ